MTVTFNTELQQSSTQSGGATMRRGKVFEIGDYPDKCFSLSADEARAAVANFTPCEIDIEHMSNTPLSGRLGKSVSVEFDGKNITGTVEEPAPLAALLGDTPRRVSLGWDRARKRIVSLAYVLSPRISGAQLVAAFSASKSADTNAVDWAQVARARKELGIDHLLELTPLGRQIITERKGNQL